MRQRHRLLPIVAGGRYCPSQSYQAHPKKARWNAEACERAPDRRDYDAADRHIYLQECINEKPMRRKGLQSIGVPGAAYTAWTRKSGTLSAAYSPQPGDRTKSTV